MKCATCSLFILDLPYQTTADHYIYCPKCSSPIKVDLRLDKRALEYNLRKAEIVLPFLRKHLKEVSESPTKLHIDQVQGSIAQLREALDYLSYYLQSPSPGAIIQPKEGNNGH